MKEYKWSNAMSQHFPPVSEARTEMCKNGVKAMKEKRIAPAEVYIVHDGEGWWIIPANINDHPLHMPIMRAQTNDLG